MVDVAGSRGGDRVSAGASSKAARIYAALKEAIIAGHLEPGSAIDKADLGARHAASRLPVTVAINRLAQENLVVVEPQRGSFVAPVRVDDIRQLMALRIALEAEAASALAAQATKQAFLEGAERSLAYQAAALDIGDRARFHELDVELHRSMIAQSRLPLFNAVIDDARSHLDRVRRSMQVIPGRMRQTLAEHRALVEAIRSGPPSRAERALRDHLESAKRHFEANAPEAEDRPTRA